jgi:hypothetical protein
MLVARFPEIGLMLHPAEERRKGFVHKILAKQDKCIPASLS